MKSITCDVVIAAPINEVPEISSTTTEPIEPVLDDTTDDAPPTVEVPKRRKR